MKLPSYENSVVSLEKLRDYCLNEEHYRGKHKARVFKSTLQFEKTDAVRLKTIIEEGIKTNEAMETFKDEYGIRYTVDILYGI